MCLRVNHKCHYKRRGSLPQPIVTDRDYITYKVISYCWRGNRRYLGTPYYGQPIRFDEEGIDKKPKVNFGYSLTDWYGEEITRGYHSFIFKKNAESERNCWDGKIIPAIIPKGTKVFFGVVDIVANEIVYAKDIKTLKENYPKAVFLSKCYNKFERED